ncbi:nucleotide exchange factor GrpE [Streptomyces sp. HNM0663]|uniref:Protein GrpE n=1 Tax=Streptomyces chengmaiensis TaxID=3040919 RepID=A0ABT6HUZ3_9ACTN|nr:nucleotide exchange factor GrpE [Streptomyces chengmaiensis]MDH2392543.1 nucleotide exchange factor GrpE [Streptomyces chengmaiensis]
MTFPRDPAAPGLGTSAPAGPPPEPSAGTDRLRRRLAERTADLKRVKAEYDNYRKRVHRDRLAIRQIAVSNVLTALLSVLDTVEQARAHGADDRAFALVADSLRRETAALGLLPVGEEGEPFDPRRHEALVYTPSHDATAAVCTRVLRRGYRVGDHLLRPAEVAVTGPPNAAARPAPPPAGRRFGAVGPGQGAAHPLR